MQLSFPKWEQESSMVNVSLARIMYGTNDNVHATGSMSPATFSARGGQPAYDDSVRNSAALEAISLDGMLRKLWSALTQK